MVLFPPCSEKQGQEKSEPAPSENALAGAASWGARWGCPEGWPLSRNLRLTKAGARQRAVIPSVQGPGIHPCCRNKWSANGPIQSGFGTHPLCQKTGALRGGPTQRMQMTKAPKQMLNNGVGTNSIHRLRLLCVCLPQIVPHSSHAIFNFSRSSFYVRGTRERGIWAGFRWVLLPVELQRASSVALPNGDLRPFGPVWQRRLYFCAECRWLAGSLQDSSESKCGRCGLVRGGVALELEHQVLGV